MKKIMILIVILFSQIILADAENNFLKAHRKPKVSYEYYEKKFYEHHQEKTLFSSALGSAKLYEEESLPKALGWNESALQQRFETIRDARFLSVNSLPDFPRRISWLYPNDGCFARASLFNRNAFQLFIPIPNKVFAFGKLKVKTTNSVRGYVYWWYHVAPIVEVQGQKMVLDPAIEPTSPIPLKEWLMRMGKPEKIKVAICGSGTYSPGDDCSKQSDGLELGAMRAQQSYLLLEMSQLERLGRNAELELGEQPPWMH